VLDGFGVPAAHVVGVSMGGALAQILALGFPDRVRSLVLISTSGAVPSGRELPPSSERFKRFFSTAEVDWSDQESVIRYLVEYSRMLSGGERPFDEDALRELVRRDMERADNFAATQNHGLLADDEQHAPPLSAIAAPTLVIHGRADPMFPLEHGQALADEIPGARLLVLEGAGHGVDPADWETVAHAIVEHTRSADAGG
jgi:pimeloyl-ACP methyl ester carboxylesterase